jgi:Na+/proline symporter
MKPLIILTLIIGYFLVLLLISHITSRKADSNSFFIGNRRSPWYIVAIGMIGASLSGVTFISVPGWVITSRFFYMQMVLGYLLGYATIVHVLLPLYYRMQLTSIYTYLHSRFGRYSYKTGAVFFLISRIIGASFRLFIVANVLQLTVFNSLNVPFAVTILITLLFIYMYTFRAGIKTIVWTDTLQTVFMLSAVIVSILYIAKSLDMSTGQIFSTVAGDERCQVFNFSDWRSKSYFFKQFLSGAFITIVMTGLDQDMMQKNLSCRSLRDAQKNMYSYSILLVPVNLIFLSLGFLLILFAHQNGITLPESSDDLFPMFATGGLMPATLGIIFILGLIAAAYSSADSALTALTTSVTIDILEADDLQENELRRLRLRVHIIMSVIIGIVIFLFKLFNNDAVISSLFKAAGYTYGPLLGLYAFGLFTKRQVKDQWIPYIAFLAPIASFGTKLFLEHIITNYQAGYEILVINGLLTFIAIYFISLPGNKATGILKT